MLDQVHKPTAFAAFSPLAQSPSYFTPLCHPLVESVSQEVNRYFLKHWNFETEKARKKFIAAGFSRVTCLYFPTALDDRIHFACRLLTVLFLIDGECWRTRRIPSKPLADCR